MPLLLLTCVGTAARLAPFAPTRRGALRAAGVLATAGVLAAWAVTLRPESLGGPAQYVVIHGNSMWPTYHEGDLIVAQRHPAYHAGEIVVYRVPKGEIGEGNDVIHRIVGGSAAAGFTLRGDNNSSADPWHPHVADVVGAAWVRLPGAGRLLVLLHEPIVPASLAAALTVAVAVGREPRRRPAHAGHPSAAHTGEPL